MGGSFRETSEVLEKDSLVICSGRLSLVRLAGWLTATSDRDSQAILKSTRAADSLAFGTRSYLCRRGGEGISRLEIVHIVKWK